MRAEDTLRRLGAKVRLAETSPILIVTKEQRRADPRSSAIPIPTSLGRVEKFYIAVGLDIERATGRMASPMMKMSHEGFGRVILSVGRLVVISKSLRDVHRFGFESFDKLAEAGKAGRRGEEMDRRLSGGGGRRGRRVRAAARGPQGGSPMSDVDALKSEIKKLSVRAIAAKMNLHDLAEDLPINWTTIMDVARAAQDAYAALETARGRLKALEAA